MAVSHGRPLCGIPALGSEPIRSSTETALSVCRFRDVSWERFSHLAGH